MNEDLHTWSIGNGEVFLYTENAAAAKVVRKIHGRGAVYERNGKVFAWQFRIPLTQLGFLEKQIGRISSIDNQRVTDVHFAKFGVGERVVGEAA